MLHHAEEQHSTPCIDVLYRTLPHYITLHDITSHYMTSHHNTWHHLTSLNAGWSGSGESRSRSTSYGRSMDPRTTGTPHTLPTPDTHTPHHTHSRPSFLVILPSCLVILCHISHTPSFSVIPSTFSVFLLPFILLSFASFLTLPHVRIIFPLLFFHPSSFLRSNTDTVSHPSPFHLTSPVLIFALSAPTLSFLLTLSFLCV